MLFDCCNVSFQVRVIAWTFDELTERDTAYVDVQVTDVNEPPNGKYLSARIYENDVVGKLVGKLGPQTMIFRLRYYFF